MTLTFQLSALDTDEGLLIAQNTFSMVSNKTPARPNLWLAIKAEPLCHPHFLHNQAIYQPSGYLDLLKLVIKL